MIRTRRLLTLTALGALAIPVASTAHADAQVYPERIREVSRSVIVRPIVERYQGNRERATETERISKTVRIGSAGEVAIGNIAGDITVTRGSGNEVVIEAIKTARGRTAEEAKEALQLVRVEIAERGNRVEVRTPYASREELRQRASRNLDVSVQYTITAPERTSIDVNTISGSVTVKDIKGNLAIETISGNIRLANAGTVSKAKTVSGGVEILDTSFEGLLETSTISGSLVLRNVKARQLDLGSVSGNVVAEDVSCDRMDAQSISGNIKLSGPLVPGGRYDLGSHSGEVIVIVSGNVGFEVEASSFSGAVRSQLELKVTNVSNRGRRQQSLRGSYGDGSAFLDLTTFSGSVIISKK